MLDTLSKIADSELEVLKLLWQNDKPMTMPEIRDALKETREWDGSTIKTLLYRLCDKGAVKAEKQNVFYYAPLITEQEYSDYATGVFLNKLYNGSAKNLLASLIGSKKLKDSDISELREMFKVGDQNE